MALPSPQRIELTPPRIALGFLAFGLAWGVLSLALVTSRAVPPAARGPLLLVLAVAFLAITALVLYRLTSWQRTEGEALRERSVARRFEEAREAFIAAAAHEFRTPLAVVKAHAQLMARRGQGDPEALAVIERQVDRLTRMTQTLLDLSRFRLGGADLEQEAFDLGALLEEVATALRAHANDRSIEVSSVAAPVTGDRIRLGQVIGRLLENALRFSPRGGRVLATLQVTSEEARVEVHDDGPGIPPERQGQVFAPPFQAAAALDEAGAFGGALDVSREIVTRHGGRMWLESAAGRGSTFAFSLPLAGQPPKELAPRAAREAEVGR